MIETFGTWYTTLYTIIGILQDNVRSWINWLGQFEGRWKEEKEKGYSWQNKACGVETQPVDSGTYVILYIVYQ